MFYGNNTIFHNIISHTFYKSFFIQKFCILSGTTNSSETWIILFCDTDNFLCSIYHNSKSTTLIYQAWKNGRVTIVDFVSMTFQL